MVESAAAGRERRRELRSARTLSELVADRYLPQAKLTKRSWRTDEMLLRKHILPALGHLPLDVIAQDQITGLLGSMHSKGYAAGTANRTLAVLGRIFSLARIWKVPGITDNPVSGLSPAPDVPRQRFLNTEEAQRLITAIEADENVLAGKAILLLLLTGARRNEITHARWDQINLDRQTLTVPLSKSGRLRTVLLNGEAVALLRSLPHVSGNPYAFPSPKTGRPSSTMYYPWDRIRRRARLPDVRLHDLRHSFASFLVNQGVSIYVLQNLLGHAQIKMTERYAHLATRTLLDATEVIASVIRAAPAASTEATPNRTLNGCCGAHSG